MHISVLSMLIHELITHLDRDYLTHARVITYMYKFRVIRRLHIYFELSFERTLSNGYT